MHKTKQVFYYKMNYQSKPHNIQAFQFTHDPDFRPPEWAVEAHKSGRLMVTINAKHKHITIYSPNKMQRAYINDWICRNENGHLFVMNAEDFTDSYAPCNSL